MSAAERLPAVLASEGPIAEPAMILVAHPDDETIGMGAQLCRFARALLVHVTDGAPRDGQDAGAYGFSSIEDYAAARRGELAAALRVGGAKRLRRRGLGIPDKMAMRDLTGLTQLVAELVRAEAPAAVFTHAYEGGHPDHDATAFAVHAACRLTDAPPAIIEMPFYHQHEDALVRGQFLNAFSWPEPESGSETTISLQADDLHRKQAMIECFATQRWLLEQFDVSVERFRLAPDYDFRRPPHPGTLYYETLGWGISGAAWRRTAAEALDCLGL